ncbi:MAG: CDP-alcohol phosphatidyltransferase family protein [Nannocystaceae bacterium]
MTSPERTPLRYAAPNLVTGLAMFFGLTAMVSATHGEFVFAGWLIIWATFLDRLDGVVARLLKATSEFGVQMDSFADFFNFGVAPAFLVYTALTTTPGLPFASGGHHVLVAVASVAWIFACTFRLARFNVIADEPRFKGLFFGVPTTIAAGTLATWFLVVLKYAAADNPLTGRDLFPEGRAFGDLALSADAWLALPIGMLVGAVLMVANVRIRKIGVGFKSPLAIALSLVALTGVAFGFARIFPELMVLLPSSFILVSLASQGSPTLRSIKPPPYLPIGKV